MKIKTINFFFENIFEKNILEIIKNMKVTNIDIANLTTGEKLNQKIKLIIIKK